MSVKSKFAFYYFLIISILCCRCSDDKKVERHILQFQTTIIIYKYCNNYWIIRLEELLDIDCLYDI